MRQCVTGENEAVCDGGECEVVCDGESVRLCVR